MLDHQTAPLTPAEYEDAREAFDAGLASAIRLWQTRLGVRADGIAGPVSWAALHRAAPASADGRAPARGLRTSDEGLALIRAFEGFRARWYRCAAGVLTIGYGHTGPLPQGVTSPLTERQAAGLLAARVEREYAEAVRDYVTAPLLQREFDALVSLAYNIGTGALRRSTVLKRLNAGDYTGASRAFDAWNKGGGRVLAGLVRRRTAERKLFEGHR